MLKGVLIAWVIAGGVATPLPGANCSPPQVEKNSAVAYVKTLVDALLAARQATTWEEVSNTNDVLTKARTLMATLKRMEGDLGCAALLLSGYESSDDEAIKMSAEAGAQAFRSLRDLIHAEVSWYRDLLDGEIDVTKTGSIAEHMAESDLKANDLWSMVPLATVAATYSLLQVDPDTGRMTRMKLTDAERESLRRTLRAAFGDDITHGVQKGQIPIVAAAAHLFQFLAEVRMKSAGAAG